MGFVTLLFLISQWGRPLLVDLDQLYCLRGFVLDASEGLRERAERTRLQRP